MMTCLFLTALSSVVGAADVLQPVDIRAVDLGGESGRGHGVSNARLR